MCAWTEPASSAITARAALVRRRLTGGGAVGLTALAVGLAVVLASKPEPGPARWPETPRPLATMPLHPAATGRTVRPRQPGRVVHSQHHVEAGLVDVTIRELRDPALFRRTLAEAGVPAVVSFGEFCRPTSDQSQISRQLVHVLKQSTKDGKVVLTISFGRHVGGSNSTSASCPRAAA